MGCSVLTMPGTPFSYLSACATIHLCLCSALSARCVYLAYGADYRVYSAEPIPWIWDIILLPGFWGEFFCCSFPQAVTSLTQTCTASPPPNKTVEIYLPLSCTFSDTFILVHPAFLHSCGFPSPSLWLCPWGLSCVCLSWPFVHNARARDLLSCLRELHIPQKYLDFVS